MIRPRATEIGLHFAPFPIYAAFPPPTHTGLLHRQAWPLSRLADRIIASLPLTAGSFFVPTQFGRAQRSTCAPGRYLPASIGGGKVVPQSPQ